MAVAPPTPTRTTSSPTRSTLFAGERSKEGRSSLASYSALFASDRTLRRSAFSSRVYRLGIVGGSPADAFTQSFFKAGGTMVLLQDIGKSFVRDLLKGPQAVAREQMQGMPGLCIERDQFALVGRIGTVSA